MESTIVSILPYDLTERKPTFPAEFHVPAAGRDDFVVVHVPDCTRSMYVLDGKSIIIPVPSYEVAGSISSDHIRSMMAVTNEAYPGIKAIPGRHEKEEVLKNFPDLVPSMRQTQNKWFEELVKLADDAWSNPFNPAKHRSITDIQRTAAKALGLNREWLTAIRIDQVQCPACRTFVPGDATICYNCKTHIVKLGEVVKLEDKEEKLVAKQP